MNDPQILTELIVTLLSEDLSGCCHHFTFEFAHLDLRVGFVFLKRC